MDLLMHSLPLAKAPSWDSGLSVKRCLSLSRTADWISANEGASVRIGPHWS